MASRTQIRLQQLTGSVANLKPASIAQGAAVASADHADLEGVLSYFAQAISNIHGSTEFGSKAPGVFTHDQIVAEGELRATQAAFLSGSVEIAGASQLKSSLTVEGAAELQQTLQITGDVTGSAGLILAGNADLNGELNVQEASVFQKEVEIKGGTSFTQATGADASLANADVVFGGMVNFQSDALIEGALEVDSGAKLSSAQIEDLTAGRVVLAGTAGEIEDSANLTFDGSKLVVTGEQQVTSHMDIDGQLDAAQAVNFQSTLAVAGAADLNGALDVAGAVDLAATGVLTNIRGTLSVDEAATFDSNVTISGNLTVSGTTTTVNTEEVTIADHNIVLDSNNSTSAIINGAGFTIEGGTGDDLTFQWSTADADMELKLGTGFAKLHIGELEASNANLSGTLTAAGNADLNGQLDVQGAANLQSTLAVAGQTTLASAQITDLTDNRVVIAGASGELEDDANFTFDGSLLNVGVPARATKIEIDSASDYIDINNGMELNSQHGAFKFMQSGNEFGKIAQDAGDLKVISNDIIFAYDDGVNAPAEIARIDGSASSLLMNGTKKLEFNDAAEAIWSSGAELKIKSNGVEYAFPQADAADVDYVLVSDGSGQLAWKSPSAAAASASKKVHAKLTAAISSPDTNGDYVYDYSGFTSAEKAAISAAANTVIDVYVNGQLLVGYKNGTPIGPNADYDWNVSSEELLFAFPLEIDDTISVIVR